AAEGRSCSAGRGRRRATVTEEGRERGRERDQGQRLDRAALGTLPARKVGALLALAQVGAERALLLAREPSVELARDRELGLVAGDRILQLLAEGAAAAEDQRLDGAHRDAEDLGDLLVGTALELAHHERGPLVEGEVAERTADVLGADGLVVFHHRLRELLVQLDLVRATLRLAEALAADVVRDRDQPVLRCARALAALEGAVGVEEGRLRDVLGAGLGAQDDERVAGDVLGALVIEPLESALGPLAG